ncbi:DUF1302 family protein [Pseudomonas alkylphenolica]|uniref:DUF1302 family protein n=1 Tax=Pseudomonas alkylphenolica TaxID=237609 RepID=A0A6I6H8V6_9PSED|nr:DUF1302 domain-containing protein [Pseudomonas alkylphenolica]QGW77048.1 DUF1302 family protein [Pseudomonas alkylphenolica]
MTTISSTRTGSGGRSPLILAVLASVAAPAQATTFDLNEDWSFTTRSTLSLGSSWSTQSPDRHLMTRANALQAQGVSADGSSVSADDNRLNFKKGDPISQTFKGLTDFSVDGQGQGAFLRLKYWYDHAYETRNGRFKDFDDSGWDDLARFQGFEALDAYLWKDLELAGHPLNVKLGKQVLSWGEALLIQNGINVINPLDITAFNRPGVEIKEGQLPVEMLSFSFGISDTLNLEGFYQYNWRPSVLDGCGTFFASSDVIQPGCGPLYLSQVLTDQQMQASGLFASSRGNESPADSGQFGFALRQMLPALNDAEAALYFINYHSRLPYLTLDARNTRLPGNFPGGGQGPTYAAAFPENIRLYGLSLTAVEPYSGISLATELSYRPNMPLAYNAPDLTSAVVAGAAGSSWVELPAGFDNRAGDRLDGWLRKGVWQWTGSATQAIDNVLGATRLSLFGEVGVVHIDGLGDERLGRNAAFGRSAPRNGSTCNTVASGVTNRYCTDQGFATDWSWGYRLRASLEYSDVLPGINLIPAVNWRHDLEGYSYDPLGPFQEGQQALGLSLTANYLNDYSVELAYNAFFGSNDYSTLDDRDFASVSFKVDF